MEDDKNHHLVFAMMRFLEAELLRSDMTPDAKESLEVGIQCLENVYGIFSSDPMVKAKYPLPATLPEIFDAGLEIKKKDYKPKVITEEDKTNADSHKTKGNEQMKAENFAGAVDEYSKAIDIDDTNAVYYCNRAAAHSKLQKHENALDDCIRALTIDPHYSKAYGRKGLAHTALSQYGDAKQCFEKALELDPSNESYKKNLELTEQKLATQGGGRGGGGGAGGLPGFPGMPGMGGGLGEMNFAQILNNPEIMNMATQMMSNPQMQQMMANMMSSFGGGAPGGEGGQAPNMDQILQAGQQIAQQLSESNPALVEQLRSAMPGAEQQPPDGQPPSDNNQPGEGGTQ